MAMTVIPRLVISGADTAIEFDRRAFGAEVTSRYTAPDGSVVNADLRIGESMLTLKDEDSVDHSATSYGGSPVLLMLAVSDADAVADAMVAAAARVIFPVSDMSYGYRQGRLEVRVVVDALPGHRGTHPRRNAGPPGRRPFLSSA